MNNPAPQSPPSRPNSAIASAMKFTPKVVYGIMLLTILVFVLQNVSIYTYGDDYFLNWGDKVNNLIVQGQLWRLVTPLLLHASIIHIGFNMYALFVIGPGLERFYGGLRFILLYLLAGIAGNVASFYFSPYDSIGASTAIFGLIAAQGVFIYRNRQIFGAQARPMLINTIVIIGVNLIFGASLNLVAGPGTPGIDNWGHLGGLFGGFAFGWFAGPLFEKQTVLVDSSQFPAGAFPTVETPLPQYAVRLINKVSLNQAWVVAGLELAVLAVLTVTRMVHSS
jgi:rhomboid protease GluP